MSHSFNKIWIHAIWATKERQHLISSTIEKTVYDYMRGQFAEMGCSLHSINGMPDHIHCLFLLNPQKSVADVIKQLKGSSSHFINYHQLTTERFAWQTGYAGYSVSESGMQKVAAYIRNQKTHHAVKTFHEEHERFLKLYGFD